MRDDLQPRPRRRNETSRLPAPAFFIRIAVICFLIGLGGWWVFNRFLKSDEEKIRDLLNQAAQAARDRTASGVTGIMSDDFVFHGPMEVDLDTFHRVCVGVLAGEFRRFDVQLTPEPLPVEVAADRKSARVDFQAHLRAKWTEDGEWKEVNSRAGGSHFVARFVLDEKGWKLREVWLKRD
jgi:hypothetical protein